MIEYKNAIFDKYNNLSSTSEHNLVLMHYTVDLCVSNILSILATADSKYKSIRIYCDSIDVESFCVEAAEKVDGVVVFKKEDIIAKYSVYDRMLQNEYKYKWWMKPIFLVDTMLDSGTKAVWSDSDIVYFAPMSGYFRNGLWFFPNHKVQLGKYIDLASDPVNYNYNAGIVVCSENIDKTKLHSIREEAINQINLEIDGKEEALWDNEQGFTIMKLFSAVGFCGRLSSNDFRLFKFHALNDSGTRTEESTIKYMKTKPSTIALHMVAGSWREMLPYAERLFVNSICKTLENTTL